jgi:hypothetical protein
MTGDYDSYNTEPGKYWVLYKNPNNSNDQRVYKNTCEGDLTSALDITPPDWSLTDNDLLARNRALIQYLKKVRAVQVRFSAPTFLGELREGLHMIRHPFQQLRTNLIDPWLMKVKHLQRTKPSTWKAVLGGAWLEQAFGWQPLFNDIKSAHKVYKGMTNARTKIPVSAFGITKKLVPARSFYDKPLNLPGNVSIHVKLTRVAQEIYIVRYRGKVVRTVNATLADDLRLWGFDAFEWIPTAWELLPWSFLVDYFSNIGEVITAGCALRSTIAYTNVSVVRLRSHATTINHDRAGTDSAHARYVDSGGFSLTTKHVNRHVQRSAGVGVGYPELRFEVPGLPAQWANMTALLAIVHGGIHPQTFFKSNRYG